MQGAILSPYLFSFYISSLPKPDYSCMIKYADDIALGCEYSSHNSTLQFDLLHLIDWSTSNNLHLNPLKCTDVTFTLLKGCKLNDFLSELNNLHVDGVDIPHCSTVRYLGVTLSRDVKWTVHVENVFMKVKKLIFYVKRLRSLSVPQNLTERFVYSYILPHLLYCSPAIYPGLLAKDWLLLSYSISLTSKISLISRNSLCEFLISKHVSACDKFISQGTW